MFNSEAPNLDMVFGNVISPAGACLVCLKEKTRETTSNSGRTAESEQV